MLYGEADFRGRSLSVAEAEYITDGSTLYEFVTLRKKTGILQKTIYPMELVGTALEGTILNVKGEKVQIHLKIDDSNPGNDCYWFPFSTPSASSDGSGWYCMPEKGDRVRVYFPSKKTSEVIAISAVSTYNPPSAAGNSKEGRAEKSAGNSGSGSSGSGSSGDSLGGGGDFGTAWEGNFGAGTAEVAQGMAGTAIGAAAGALVQQAGKEDKDAGKDKMGDPATKYLRVPSGQEVKLSPKGIEVLCSGGSAKIEVLKSGRINISATDSIQITAQNKITMRAKYTLKVQCKKNASFASLKGGSIQMNKQGKLEIKGTEVHVN